MADILNTFDQYENESEMLKQVLQNAEKDFSSPLARRVLNELTEPELKEILEKAKLLLADQLLKPKET